MNTQLDVINPQPDSPNRTRAKPNQRWGNWRFNAENLTLAYEPPSQADHESVRYIDLERAVTPALLLDMFIQMFTGRVGDSDDQAADPSVFTPKDVSDLVQAIEEVIDPQATLCSCGMAKKLDPAKFFADQCTEPERGPKCLTWPAAGECGRHT